MKCFSEEEVLLCIPPRKTGRVSNAQTRGLLTALPLLPSPPSYTPLTAVFCCLVGLCCFSRFTATDIPTSAHLGLSKADDHFSSSFFLLFIRYALFARLLLLLSCVYGGLKVNRGEREKRERVVVSREAGLFAGELRTLCSPLYPFHTSSQPPPLPPIPLSLAIRAWFSLLAV